MFPWILLDIIFIKVISTIIIRFGFILDFIVSVFPYLNIESGALCVRCMTL